MTLLEVADDPRFATFAGRVAHREEVEAVMVEYCASRTCDEVVVAFAAAHAAVGPVLDMADIAADPHYAARGIIAEIDGVPMQGLIARLGTTPGALRWAGRPLDADGDEIRATGWGIDRTADDD